MTDPPEPPGSEHGEHAYRPSRPSGYFLGYHGCTSEVANACLQGEDLRVSTNTYDWLGSGVYFWQDSEARASSWAAAEHGNDASVIGALIALGNCLDLLDERSLDFVFHAKARLLADLSTRGEPLPENRLGNRKLDCAVINYAVRNLPPACPSIDTVRGAFTEGDRLAPDSGIYRQNHIQIAVLNPNCIKGVFLPRNIDLGFPQV